MAPAIEAEAAPERRVPTRADVLLFEDSAARAPFAGYRERFDPTALPEPPLPATCAFQPTATGRGPLVDGGAGEERDIERLIDLGIELEGAVLLVDAADPDGGAERTLRWLHAMAVAERAAAAGCVAVLVVEATDGFIEPATTGPPDPLPLPVLTIRPADRAALLSRLRVRRVRGEDGRAVSLRTGPGPVEAAFEISDNLR